LLPPLPQPPFVLVTVELLLHPAPVPLALPPGAVALFVPHSARGCAPAAVLQLT
jgi:hypothetical protein